MGLGLHRLYIEGDLADSVLRHMLKYGAPENLKRLEISYWRFD